jgi:hypothetical protein
MLRMNFVYSKKVFRDTLKTAYACQILNEFSAKFSAHVSLRGNS